MLLNAEIPLWTQDAARLLAQFLATPTGAAALANLASRRPSLQGGNYDLTTRALAGAEAGGFEKCFSALTALAVIETEKNEPATGNYPDLGDEAAWKGHPTTP